MNEYEELKRKLGEVLELLKKVLAELLKKGDEKFSQWIPDKSIRLVVTAIAVSFILGALFGSALNGKKSPGGVSKEGPAEHPSVMRFLFGKSIPVPGHQTDGSFVFSGFEKDSDLKAWELKSSKMDISAQHAVEGKQSARVIFYGGEDVSSISINDYFSSRKGKKDWSPYEAVGFYIFNPRNETERLILQIKDERGNRYKQDVHIPGGKGEDTIISIERLSGKINVRKIDQFDIFRWEPKGDKEFYFDNIRLLPTGYAKQIKAQGKPVDIPVKDRPVRMLDYGFSARKPMWQIHYPAALGGNVVRVPFILKNETSSPCLGCPVDGGIPLPMGELKDVTRIRLKNAASQEIPFQSRTLGRWPDGSIKWLGLNFKAALEPDQGAGYLMEYGADTHAADFPSSLSVKQDDMSIIVNTGASEIELAKNRFYLFKRVSFDKNLDGAIGSDEVILKNALLTLSFQSEEYRADLDNSSFKIAVEETGGRRVVIKASSWFQSGSGKRFCQVIVRYYFYEGENFVKISHTLVYTGYPENIYYDKYKGLKLPANEPIDSISLKIPLESDAQKPFKARVSQSNADLYDMSTISKWSLLQLGWEQTEIQKDEIKEAVRDIPTGWADAFNDDFGVGVTVRDFRENFPKAYRMSREGTELEVDLWPKEAGPLDLATSGNTPGPEDRARGNAFGLAKTHELLIQFHGAASDPELLLSAHVLASFAKPLVIRSNPYWIDSTGALGRLYPVDQKFATEEKMLEKLFDWADRQPRDFKWYGMLNFGDTLSWWRNEDDDQWYGDYGWHPVGRWGWYNCEGIGTHTGALLQFARSGVWKYFEFGARMARHIMDIDTVHYNTVANDPRLKNELDDEVSEVGSMHRHSGDHWGGRNEESSHTSVVGILLYYFLSGDERALDVAKEIGEFFLKEPFTYTGHPDVAPHRALANALWGDVLLYEATGEERYKKAADRIIEIYLKGQQSDGSFLENYNPLQGTWSGEKHADYMGGYALGAFMSYHELTQDEEVKEMLLKLVRFLNGSGVKAESLHGFAYAYFITGDPAFINMIDGGLTELLNNKQESSDSMMDGLIYKKAIYHRPKSYLYSTPYAFEAIQASQGRPPS